MHFIVKDMDIASGGIYIAILNEKDAKKLDLHSGDRVIVKHNNKEVTCILDLSESNKAVPEGKLGLFEEVLSHLHVKNNTKIELKYTPKPESIIHIREKLFGKRLTYEEIYHIVDDITNDRLTDVEKTYFVTACFSKGLNTQEIVDLTRAMVETGSKLKFPGIILDKHCLSGDVPLIVRNSKKMKVKKIGEMVDTLFEEQKEHIVNRDGAEYLEKNPKNIHVLTFGENGLVTFAPVTGFFRVASPPQMHEITLLGNRKVTVTPDHTIFILKQGKIINVPASQITEHDFVLVPKSYQQTVLPIESIIVEKNSNNRLKKIKDIPLTLEFLRLLAYYLGEGFTNEQGIFLNFGSHEKELIEDAKQCVETVFGFAPTINIPHPTAVRVSIYSQQVSYLFHTTLNLGSNALEKRIPSFVFDLPQEQKLTFIQTLFKCDGHIRRGYEATYVTVSEQLYLDLQYLLSLLGISVTATSKEAGKRMFPRGEYPVHKSYYIYTQAREIFGNRQHHPNVSYLNLLPIKELGPLSLENSPNYELKRSFRRQTYVTVEKLRQQADIINCSDVHKILQGDLAVLPVKQNQQVPPSTPYVYDLYVEGYNKFMAGTAPMAVHNCIGGIPGNRTTMVVVPIIAAAGFTIPKTSSRAITSPAGTADTMECLAKVELPAKKIKQIIHRIGACIVHGGSMNLAPADDKIIQVEHPLSIDAEGQLLASVMAKKYSVGATHVLIDIPMGKSTKANTWPKAKHLKHMFELIGKKLNMDVKVIITDGSQPIGCGVGPLLEAQDVMAVLRNDPKAPSDLRKKSLQMAGLLLEMTGKYKDGFKVAKELLDSGKAFKKMNQIIAAQGKQKPLKLALFTSVITAPKTGRITSIDNEIIAKIARIAGAPDDKAAGLFIHKKVNDFINKNDSLYTIYAESKFKLNLALEVVNENNGYSIH